MRNEKINQVLESGTKAEKIETLESLENTNDSEIINKIISKLDDSDIEVRGEAFSSLVLNENNISNLLVQNLKSENKNIRGYSTLVLANRRNSEAISEIMNLTLDKSSMVRSCALGALGHLKAVQANQIIQKCFSDSSLEVKKSAIKDDMAVKHNFSKEDITKLSEQSDEELEKLILQVKIGK